MSDDEENARFWGPNAIPMAVQFIAGTAIVAALVWVGFADASYAFFYNLSCTYVTGSCL